MKISFFRGDNHEVKFRFPNFNGTIDKIYLTVKCSEKKTRLQKKLNDGIKLEDNYYVATFVPEDTNDLPCYLKMVYDIEIITGGKKYTVIKDEFEIQEDVTLPENEV